MYDYLFYKFYARGKSQEYVLDKDKSVAAYKGYMINRLQKMFHYENLPETIPQYMLEYYLLVNGSCLIAEYHGKPYAFLGAFGGEPDPYYRPTKYVVANPALKMNETFDLWSTDGSEAKKCVLMRNDVMWMGLNPLMSRYAALLAENVVTLRTADVMLRVVAMLSAPDDKTRAAAEEYLRGLEIGKIGVIGENRFFDGIKLQSPPSNNGSYLTQFIELQQYYKGSFFNEIGLSAAFNMKREAIGEGEATLNEDTLVPLIDTMMECRQEDVSRLNELFDLNVTVEFDSAWKQNIEEAKLNMMVLKAEGEESDDDGEINGSHNASTNDDEGYSGSSEGSQSDGGPSEQYDGGESDSGSSSGDSNDAAESSEDTALGEEGNGDTSSNMVSQLTQVNIQVSMDPNNNEGSDLISGDSDDSVSQLTDDGESDDSGDSTDPVSQLNGAVNIQVIMDPDNKEGSDLISDSEEEGDENDRKEEESDED